MNVEYKKLLPLFILPLLMLGALAVRLIYLAEAPMETRDGISYVNFTQQWFEMGQAAIPSFDRVPPPLFCYLGKTLMFSGIDAATALLIINMTCGVLLLIPAYLIGKNIYNDPGAGLWFAGFAAVMPPLVTPATDTLVTTPVYVLPSTASAVTSTVCPTATSEMSSSSIFMVISR